jgi:drug/metabolite transporter (DMT)-like permease
MNQFIPFLFVFGTMVGTVVGQLLIKAGVLEVTQSMHEGAHNLGLFLLKALVHPLILAGFVSAFLAAIFWIFALRTLPLNVAYPMMAFTIVLVIFVSSKFLHEPIDSIQWLAFGLIITGVTILFFSNSHTA